MEAAEGAMGAMAMWGYAMLQHGEQHGDEVPADAAGKWLALVREPGTPAVLQVVDVEVETVRDVVMDDEDRPPTGKKVVLVGENPPRDVLILMRGPGLIPGPVKVAPEPPRPLFPGDRQFLTFGDGYVELFGVGSTNDEGTVETYGLFAGGIALMPRQPMGLETGARVPSVQLAGDFDRDGRLDFLVSTSNHYNVHELTLFLANGANGAWQPVAVWRSTGC